VGLTFDEAKAWLAESRLIPPPPESGEVVAFQKLIDHTEIVAFPWRSE
jgi:hypothetical protein